MFIEGTSGVFKSTIGKELETMFGKKYKFHKTDYGSLKSLSDKIFNDKEGLLAIPIVFMNQIIQATTEKEVIHIFDRSHVSPYMYQFIHERFDKVPAEEELKKMNILFPSTAITCINTNIQEVENRIMKRNGFDVNFIKENKNYVFIQNEIFKQFANMSQTPLLDLANLSYSDCFYSIIEEIQKLFVE